ncbi:MAG: hypothetical protein Q7J07_02890 [Pelolinea sp.]|nr:hypothetical protein [Pelolinea sp.]
MIINRKEEKRILLYGFHFIKRGEQVLHLINFNIHHFYLGSNDRKNPSTISTSDSVDARNHLHLLRSTQTSGRTKDGLTIVPRFSVYFNLLPDQDVQRTKDFLLDLSNIFSAQNIYGELHKHLEDLIGKSIISIWNTLIQETNTEELTTPTEEGLPLVDEYIRKINIFLNENSTEDIFNLPNRQIVNLPEGVHFLKKWKLLNLKVFLDTLWIEQ